MTGYESKRAMAQDKIAQEPLATLFGSLPVYDVPVVDELPAQEPVANGKLKVTLQDTPTEIELAQYKRMFEAACYALVAIGEVLGVDEDEGGAEPILAAIAELKASLPPRQPLTSDEIDDIANNYSDEFGMIAPDSWEDFAQAILKAAHGIKGEA